MKKRGYLSGRTIAEQQGDIKDKNDSLFPIDRPLKIRNRIPTSTPRLSGRRRKWMKRILLFTLLIWGTVLFGSSEGISAGPPPVGGILPELTLDVPKDGAEKT